MKVKVIKAGLKSYWYADKVGQTFEVTPFDGTYWGYKLVSNESHGSYFDKYDVELINEEKKMKREDKINLEMTLQGVAWLYAITARANGTIGYDIYKNLKSMVDPDGKAYNKYLGGKFNLIDYRSVQEEFEAAIFDRKSPAQIELEALQTKINELQSQAEKLQGLINK